MVKMDLISIALFLMVSVYEFKAEKVIFETDYGLITEDIKSDPAGETLLVTVGDVSAIEGFVGTTNLHDLSTGWTALRGNDGAVETCLLKPSGQKKSPSMNRMHVKDQRLFVKAVTFYWKIKPGMLSYEETVELTGDKIADFCAAARTYVIAPSPIPVASKRLDDRGFRSDEVAHRRYRRGICIFCWRKFVGTADLDEVDVINTDHLKL